MKKFLILILILFSTQEIFSQSQLSRGWNPSVNTWQFSAGVEGAIGTITNPAVLGLYKETDLWYTGHVQHGNVLEHNFFISTPFLFTNVSVNYRKAFDDAAKNVADIYGFGIGIGTHSFAFGYTADFLVSKDVTARLSNFGILFKPNRILTLSFVVKNFMPTESPAFTFPREETFGGEIRPFKNDRVAFFADMKSASSTFLHDLNFNIGTEVKIISGLLLLASYHEYRGVQEPLYSIGLRFNFSQSSLLGITSFSGEQFPGTSYGVHLTNTSQDTDFGK